MNKQEIDLMMRDLPSQRHLYEESLLDKCLGGFAFIAFVAMICFM